jgi:hypothetical protein
MQGSEHTGDLALDASRTVSRMGNHAGMHDRFNFD